jgi:hypothetical protein
VVGKEGAGCYRGTVVGGDIVGSGGESAFFGEVMVDDETGVGVGDERSGLSGSLVEDEDV